MSIIRDLIGVAISNNGHGVNNPNNGASYNNYPRGLPMDRCQLRQELRHGRLVGRMHRRQLRREYGLIRSGVSAVIRHLDRPSDQPPRQQQTYEPMRSTEPVYPRQQMRPAQEQGVSYGQPANPQYGQQSYAQQGYGQPVPGSRELMQWPVGEVEPLEPLEPPPPSYNDVMRSEGDKRQLPNEFRR